MYTIHRASTGFCAMCPVLTLGSHSIIMMENSLIIHYLVVIELHCVHATGACCVVKY